MCPLAFFSAARPATRGPLLLAIMSEAEAEVDYVTITLRKHLR